MPTWGFGDSRSLHGANAFASRFARLAIELGLDRQTVAPEGFCAHFGCEVGQFQAEEEAVPWRRTVTPLRDRAGLVEVRPPPEADPRTRRDWDRDPSLIICAV